MKPTPEQIAAMEARGWKYDPAQNEFRHVSEGAMWFVVSARSAWAVGFRGRLPSGEGRAATPELAADEAESWLKGVLSGLRFPWLGVKP